MSTEYKVFAVTLLLASCSQNLTLPLAYASVRRCLYTEPRTMARSFPIYDRISDDSDSTR